MVLVLKKCIYLGSFIAFQRKYIARFYNLITTTKATPKRGGEKREGRFMASKYEQNFMWVSMYRT
jgi:hypothetical protein